MLSAEDIAEVVEFEVVGVVAMFDMCYKQDKYMIYTTGKKFRLRSVRRVERSDRLVVA